MRPPHRLAAGDGIEQAAALARPLRRLYYNLTVTGLSVAVALGIGAIELLAVLALSPR